MDNLNQIQRSARMASVRQKHTEPELIVRRALHRQGYRFRLHAKNLPGTPDIVLPKYNLAIFVHGCFWHGHHCKGGRAPKTNANFWVEKQLANRTRDQRKIAELERLGWLVIEVWQCQTKRADELIEVMQSAGLPMRVPS